MPGVPPSTKFPEVPGEPSHVPPGTVIILCSDVVGSTGLWEVDPEAMSSSLRIHDRLFAETIAAHGGRVFSTAGDSFAAAFDRAGDAVACAGSVQAALGRVDWGNGPPLAVRIGLHLGVAEERDGDYLGPAVDQAAQVMAVAHGGQCVLTDEVRDAAGAEGADLGTHTLRAIGAPVHLSQLGDHRFPPLWSAGTTVVALPSPRTSLVGRDESVEHVRKLVAAHRLVTLTGADGCGKTRLSVETAYREVPSHPQGVWFVDLSTVADEVALPGAFVGALGLAIDADEEPIDRIVDYLAPRVALLVVDECEHVVDAVADVVDRLLDACPDLRIVATSREALEVDGECTWRVPSLPTGRDAAAVRLFVDRAAAAGAELGEDARTTETVRDIVERLDGIPLAIELAAARTRTLSVGEILRLLDDRFSHLSGGSRRARPRRATLEEAVRWTFDLLSEEERDLLLALSAFQGGFEEADVAVVARMSETETRKVVDALVATSMVDVDRDAAGGLRHRLLGTIRRFAWTRLVEAGEATSTRDRHLDHFAGDERAFTFADWCLRDRVVRSGREYGNLRSAVTWALRRGRVATAVRMTANGVEAAAARGEARLAVEVLRTPCDLRPGTSGLARGVLATLLVAQDDPVAAIAELDDVLATGADRPGDHLVLAHTVRGSVAGVLGELAEARHHLDEARRIAAEIGDPALTTSTVPCDLGDLVLRLRPAEAVALADRGLAAAPRHAWRHVIESYRAFALLLCDRVEEAARSVERFTPAPDGSRWAHLDPLVAHLVAGHLDGPAPAGRSLAAAMEEPLRRGPRLRSDVLLGFAYLDRLAGDHGHVAEIVGHTVPHGAGPVFSSLVNHVLGSTVETVDGCWAGFFAATPPVERMRRDREHGRRLLDEELARWS